MRPLGARRYTAVELGRRAGAVPRTDDRLFTGHHVDTVAAMMAGTPPADTRWLAGERRVRLGRRTPSRA